MLWWIAVALSLALCCLSPSRAFKLTRPSSLLVRGCKPACERWTKPSPLREQERFLSLSRPLRTSVSPHVIDDHSGGATQDMDIHALIDSEEPSSATTASMSNTHTHTAPLFNDKSIDFGPCAPSLITEIFSGVDIAHSEVYSLSALAEAFLDDTVSPPVTETETEKETETELDIPRLLVVPNKRVAMDLAKLVKNAMIRRFRSALPVLCFHSANKITDDLLGLYKKNILAIISTPDRLIHHLYNTPLFAQRLLSLQTVAVYESNHLHTKKFRCAMKRIFAKLSVSSSAKTHLFSAAVSEVETLQSLLEREFEYTISPEDELLMRDNKHDVTTTETASEREEGEEEEETYEHVPQELVVLPEMRDLVATVYAVLQEQVQRAPQDHKIIVFFPTARMAGFMAEIFSDPRGLNFPVLSANRPCKEFNTGKGMILFASDSLTLDADIPDVTFVLQVGSTEKSQYIHRLGRTARAGKEGAGMLVLNEFEEESSAKELRGLLLLPRSLSTIDTDAHAERVRAALQQVSKKEALFQQAKEAYEDWLTHYCGRLGELNWSKEELAQMANEFGRSCGLRQTPVLDAHVLKKLDLIGVPGLLYNKWQKL